MPTSRHPAERATGPPQVARGQPRRTHELRGRERRGRPALLRAGDSLQRTKGEEWGTDERRHVVRTKTGYSRIGQVLGMAALVVLCLGLMAGAAAAQEGDSGVSTDDQVILNGRAVVPEG